MDIGTIGSGHTEQRQTLQYEGAIRGEYFYDLAMSGVEWRSATAVALLGAFNPVLFFPVPELYTASSLMSVVQKRCGG
jgi:hypothetical protein